VRDRQLLLFMTPNVCWPAARASCADQQTQRPGGHFATGGVAVCDDAQQQKSIANPTAKSERSARAQPRHCHVARAKYADDRDF
jgi:hypothetical protein